MKIIEEQYFRISNSGVTFRVIDDGLGPTIQVISSAFGNMRNEFTLHVRRDNLAALGKMFSDAALSEYSSDYCNATDLYQA